MTAEEVTACFREVDQQMRELPFYNPRLTVEIYGWHSLDAVGEIAILITPWCLNLLVFPDTHQHLPAFGESFSLNLPNGDYQLYAARHERLGRYAYASLHSDMFVGFADQDQAREMAATVMQRLLQEPSTPSAPPRNLQRRHFFERLLGFSPDAGARGRV